MAEQKMINGVNVDQLFDTVNAVKETGQETGHPLVGPCQAQKISLARKK